ncbi:MAG: hypothetical protein R2834_03160 [Rhodothermales bacterium]
MTVQQTIHLPGYARPRLDRHTIRFPWFAASEPPPTNEDAGDIDAYLEQALNLPTPARQAYLDRICEDKPALRQRLNILLEGIEDDVPPGFLKPLPNTRSILSRIKKAFGDPPAPNEE